jgi:hypothetical protein
MVRKTTDSLIEVIINGTYTDVENNVKPYRIKIEMPDCIDEWLLPNIKHRYALNYLRKGKEFKNDKEVDNKDYLNVAKINVINVEEIDENGNNTIKTLNKLPSFYGKSLFNFTYFELQDFSTAFGLHSIRETGENIESMRMTAFLEYLDKVKGISGDQVKQFSFYKYDRTRRHYYLELNEEEKKNFIIDKRECVDLKYFEEQDERIKEGNRSILDLLDKKSTYHDEKTQVSKPKVKDSDKTIQFV